MKSGLQGLVLLGIAAGIWGCESKKSASPDLEPRPAPSARAAESPSAAEPVSAVPEEAVRKVLNPLGVKPYSGPTATVAGVVTVSGDPPPVLDEVLKQIDGKCEGAKAQYGKLFREGPERALADVLVAVTEYEGFVPPDGKTKTVVAKDCAFQTRTVALTFGQTLQVVNKGGEAVIPELVGTKTHALVVAMPGGDPVTLFPTHVGNFVLKDNTRDYALAEVFVLKYSTTDVTGLDGRFEITGVPVGKARVSAYLPITGQTVQKQVELKAGERTNLEFEIAFDASKHAPKAPD